MTSKDRSVNMNIMVIDDSEFSRRAVVEILENEGFNVVAQASSAEEATQLLGTVTPHLFIIDVVMPDVSGIDLAKHIAENSMNIYIVMMSSLDMEHIIIESISNGAIDFLKKPFSKEELIRSVEKIEVEIAKD